jgi:hypothetical protein
MEKAKGGVSKDATLMKEVPCEPCYTRRNQRHEFLLYNTEKEEEKEDDHRDAE